MRVYVCVCTFFIIQMTFMISRGVDMKCVCGLRWVRIGHPMNTWVGKSVREYESIKVCQRGRERESERERERERERESTHAVVYVSDPAFFVVGF